jgi:hypothetical protein
MSQTGWLNSEGLVARIALPEVARQPPPGKRLDGLGHPLAQGRGQKPSTKKSQGVSTALPAPKTWQPSPPQPSPGKLQRASTLA